MASGISVLPDQVPQLEKLWQGHKDEIEESIIANSGPPVGLRIDVNSDDLRQKFLPGHDYTIDQIAESLGSTPSSLLENEYGYYVLGDDTFIFVHLRPIFRGQPDYLNQWIDDELYWEAGDAVQRNKASGRRLTKSKGKGRIWIFARSSRETRYTFDGFAQAVEVDWSRPVSVIWRLLDDEELPIHQEKDNGIRGQRLLEGSRRELTLNVFERNPLARRECLEHYGYKCLVCDFDFEETYGELGRDFIHVHHIRPLSEIGEEYLVNPITDLRPVCPNCHAMIHRYGETRSMESLRLVLSDRVSRRKIARITKHK